MRLLDCQTATGITWHYGVRLFHPYFFSLLAQPGDETFLFCGGFAFGFVWLCCFGFVFGFNCLIRLFFTQKLWSLSSLSGRALDLLRDLCLGTPSIFTSL